MKFEKLKRLYKFLNEFKSEIILEVQNVYVPCKFKNYEDIDELIERLEKDELKNDLVLFESGQIGVGKDILINSQGCIYLSSGGYETKKIIIARNIDEFFSKFKISFQHLPTVEEILKKRRYISLYLDEKYTNYDIAKLIEQAAKEGTSKIEIKHVTQTKNTELENFIEITNLGISKRIHFNLNSRSLTDYIDNELNSYLNDKLKCDFKFTIVHENIWDSRAKVVFVNLEEYENLKESNLIMEEVKLSIN
jgi:hypothetical protein